MDPNESPTWDRRRLMSQVGAIGIAATGMAPRVAEAQPAAPPLGGSESQASSHTKMAGSPAIAGLHHVGVRSFDMEASKRFWCDVLGFVAHPEKGNWLGIEGSERKIVHLMPAEASGSRARVAEDMRDMANHVALEVSDLRVVVARLLENGLKPYQADLDPSARREIASRDGSLDFGIGTVFVADPSGNIVEFIQRDAGIFAKIKG